MFKKQIVTTRGSLASFHGIFEIKAKFPEDTQFSAIVYSYCSEGDYLQGIQPIKKTEVFIPVSAVGTNFLKSLEQWLINNNEGFNIFYGGELKNPMPTDPLEYARDKQKAIIKSSRDVAMAKIDADLSTGQISNAVDTIKSIYQGLKDQLVTAQTIPEIEAIVWPTN